MYSSPTNKHMKITHPNHPLQLLIIYKKNQLKLYIKHKKIAINQLHKHKPSLYNHFQNIHKQNTATIEHVHQYLHKRKHQNRFVHQTKLIIDPQNINLIININKNNTLLDINHSIQNLPLLKINSSPKISIKHFCTTNTSQLNKILDTFRNQKLIPKPLTHLQISLNGHIINTPILNKVLLTHIIPTTINQYILQYKDTSKKHKSSKI